MASRSIVHMELVTPDVEKASKFYQEAFDWNIMTDAVMHYTMFQSGPAQWGGFVTPQAADPEHPEHPEYKLGQVVLYLSSDDIDTDLVKVENMGGKIVSPKLEIPNTGWMAVFEDPTGNRMGLYKSMHPTEEQELLNR